MKMLLSLAALLGVAHVAPALAQSLTPPTQEDRPAATPPAPAPRPAHAHVPHAWQPGETVQHMVERRIAELHRQLQITPAQAQAWDEFAQVMRDNARTSDQAYRERGAHLATMSAVDNLQSFARLEQERAQGVQRLAASFQTLYNSLSEQQKQSADRLFRHYGERAPERRHFAARHQPAASPEPATPPR